MRRSALTKLKAVPSARADAARTVTGKSGYGALATLIRGRLNTKPLSYLLLRACDVGASLDPSCCDGSSTAVQSRLCGGTSSPSTRHRAQAADAAAAAADASVATAFQGGYERLDAAHFLSQSLLDVSFVDMALLDELACACALVPGDLLSLKIGSFPTVPFLPSTQRRLAGHLPTALAYRAEWSVTDSCCGVLAQGDVATDLFGQRVLVFEHGGPGLVYAAEGNGQAVPLPDNGTADG